MSKILKILNPFIWLYNIINYLSHLESYRYSENYEPYDFSNDCEYF